MYPNIEAERARKHLSAEQLATELGVTRKTYYNWCKRGKIPQNKLILMSEIFGVSADYLLCRDGESEERTCEDVGPCEGDLAMRSDPVSPERRE